MLIIYLKAAQRLALPAAGGTRLAHETDETQSHEKHQFGGENPAVRVHAVLGGFYPEIGPIAQKIKVGTLVRK